MSQREWQVYKFGGTSMENADALKQVANLITNSDSENLIVVVSAMSGMTDDLLKYSQTRDSKLLEQIQSRYSSTIKDLLKDESNQLSLLEVFREDIQTIKQLVDQVDFSSVKVEDNQILGFGEIWSSKLLNAYLDSLGEVQPSWLNPMDFLIIQNQEMGANVNWSNPKTLLQIAFKASLVKSLWGVSLHQMRMAIQQI